MEPRRQYSVVVADKDALLRAAVRQRLHGEPDFRVVAEASDVSEAFEAVAGHDADVIVLDWGLPGRGGLETLQRFHAAWPALVIISFAVHDPRTFGPIALRAGAAAFVAKERPDGLLDELRAAVARSDVDAAG